MMLYGRHLGIKGQRVRQIERVATSTQAQREWEAEDPKSFAIWKAVDEVKHDYRDSGRLAPRAIYRFLRAAGRGNRLFLAAPGEKTAVFDFPRQRRANGLCLADYVLPAAGDAIPAFDDLKDSVGIFIVTVGDGVRELAETLKNKGDYLRSHIVQALALESAEAYAEWMHAQMRKAWGFPDPIGMTMIERFQARYRGKRYSFGYPACPRLDDQKLLFDLLQPAEIGVQLTEGFMMDPEASVSALVFHHPNASYFSVGVRESES
jgi:5-methyltetrahydrofolate--homocysteine methyltransferase